jgi:hypothetical protein
VRRVIGRLDGFQNVIGAAPPEVCNINVHADT